MNYNDILKRTRYTFDFSDDTMMDIFKLGGMRVDRSQISNWMKAEDHEEFAELNDKELASFLNGFIVKKRGAQEGKTMVAEDYLHNNLILRKFIIALSLKSEEVLAIFKLADKELSKHQLSSFFRKQNHPKYMQCHNQFLRCFIRGMQMKYRPK